MRKKQSTRKNTLAIVGSLLVLSAILRLGTEAGQVIANEPSEIDVPEAVAQSSDLSRPEHLEELLATLKAREARLVERERDIEMRERTLEIAEEEIDKQLTLLEETENSLEETITLASKAAEKDLVQLTTVYSNMKPKQAAALFEQMDASFAAGFLARMPPDSAARVLAGMTPEKAYHVSVELAGRNADIPLK